MSFHFNPFTGSFDEVGSSSRSSWQAPVADVASLPTVGNQDGDVRVALDVNDAYQWDDGSSTWIFLGKVKAGSFGSSPNANGFSVGSDNTLTLQPADATHPGSVTTGSQTFAGTKTFSGQINADGGVDVTNSGGTDTLSIGTINADIINIGNPAATINFTGTVNNNNVTNLNVTDSLITINDGGGAGSGSGAGIEVEEAGSITGYTKVSADRNSWILKAPNTAGDVTLTPGASGITLNQSSHNPVTIGTANGLSLSTQQLSLGLASTSTTGALSSTDWNTFNNKQDAGNYITGLTGDVSASGPGSVAATVNSVGGSSAANVHAAELLANAATNANTVSTIVKRDGSGNFSAGTITANLTGNASGNLLKASGDINETSFSASNNQAVAADVTGLAFANATVRSFDVLLSIYVDATTDLFESFKLHGIQKGSSWAMSQTSVGDASGFVFSITNAGQIQYTNSNYTGFVSATVKFRAVTTSV